MFSQQTVLLLTLQHNNFQVALAAIALHSETHAKILQILRGMGFYLSKRSFYIWRGELCHLREGSGACGGEERLPSGARRESLACTMPIGGGIMGALYLGSSKWVWGSYSPSASQL